VTRESNTDKQKHFITIFMGSRFRPELLKKSNTPSKTNTTAARARKTPCDQQLIIINNRLTDGGRAMRGVMVAVQVTPLVGNTSTNRHEGVTSVCGRDVSSTSRTTSTNISVWHIRATTDGGRAERTGAVASLLTPFISGSGHIIGSTSTSV
jgi:hypothetical protein